MNHLDEQILTRKIANKIIAIEQKSGKWINDETLASDYMTYYMNQNIENLFKTTIADVRTAKIVVLLEAISCEIKNDKLSGLLTKLIYTVLSIEDFESH